MDTKGESWGWDELGDWDPHIYILLTLCIKKITIENLKKKRERDTQRFLSAGKEYSIYWPLVRNNGPQDQKKEFM